MDYDIFNMYIRGMEQIRNEEMLERFTAETYTKVKSDSRSKLHRGVYKSAFPNEFNNPKNVIKLSDIHKVLK